MLASPNAPLYMQQGGSTRQTAYWIRQYAHMLWEIIGIGEEPNAEQVTISAKDVGSIKL